jgi:NTE family protein
VLSLRGRALGRTLVSTGLRARSNLDGDSNFALLTRISRRPFSSGGGELAFSGQFGTDIGTTLELYQPVGGAGRFFVEPSVSYLAEELLFDFDDIRIGEFWQQAGTAQVRVGRELGEWGVISVEALTTGGRVRPQVTIFDAIEPFETDAYWLAGVGARLGVDTLDTGDWPRAGMRLMASAQHLESVQDSATNNKYRLALLKGAGFGAFGINLRVRGELIQSENDDPVELLALGGFRQLSAFSPNSILADEYLLGGLEVFRRLTSEGGVVDLPVYLGLTLEYANVQLDLLGQERNLGAVGLYLGAATPVGPVQFGVGFSDEGRYSFFLNVGRAY